MANNSLKILITGGVNGQYDKLFKRVNDVNRKAGPFDLLFCVGDFFGTNLEAYDELINGSTDVTTIPTYILSRTPKKLLKFHPSLENFDQGCELIDGITLLGRSGILTTSLGLRIAYLNGKYRSKYENDDDLDYFSDKEFEQLMMSCQSSSEIVDVLLTIEWPKKILNFSGANIDDSISDMIDKNSSMKISQLCYELKPRYHFVGGLIDWYWEREPYRNHQVLIDPTRNVTRFLSIANINNDKKMKWIYAFNIVPSRHLTMQEIASQPNGVTENPFRNFLLEQSEQNKVDEERSNQFRYDLSNNKNNNNVYSNRKFNDKRKHHDNQNYQRKEMKRNEPIEQQNCWFCLASPDVDKSLIISIGDHSYLALAKGGLTEEHMMILPIEHIRSTIEIENENLREEINKFKESLTKFYATKLMVPIFFERNFKSSHFQIQAIGLPETKISFLRQAVDDVFEKFDHHEISSNDQLNDIIAKNIPYFYFECSSHYKFLIRIQVKKEFFPIQIGRQLLAHKLLLNCPERIDWKYCHQNETKSSEELTRKIREEFRPFDFTI